MRLWKVLLPLVVAGSLLAIDPGRRELFANAVAGVLPPGVAGRMTYRAGERCGLSAWSDEFRAVADDPDRPVGERLGACELSWLCATLRGDAFRGKAFERHLEMLLERVQEIPEEPAFCALAIDALRSHRGAVGPLAFGPEADQERRLAREILRLCFARDPDNGYFHLVAAEVALAEGRVAEAQDSLRAASRSSFVDPRLRPRSAAAYAYLRARGLPELETREFLLDDGYGVRNFGAGDLLDGIAAELGRLEARRVDAEPDAWIPTFLALHQTGWLLTESTLLDVDARQALDAGNLYLDVVRGGVRGLHRPVPRVLSDASAVDAMVERLMNAGYMRGAAQVGERSRGPLARLGHRLGEARGARRQSEGVIRLTRGHAILIPWGLICLTAALVFLAGTRAPADRKIRLPSSPGLDLAAALFPFGLLAWLGLDGRFPFSRGGVAGDWLEALGAPHPLLYLVPLTATLLIVLPHVTVPRFRTPTSLFRRLTSFFAGYGALLILAFAVTAPIIESERAQRVRALGDLLIELPDRPRWPEITADRW